MVTKARKLTVAEMFYVQHHRNENPSVLAKTLKAPVVSVRKFLESLPTPSNETRKFTEEQVEKATLPVNGKPLPEDNFIKRRGAVVMTREESERSDANKPKTRKQPKGVTSARR